MGRAINGCFAGTRSDLERAMDRHQGLRRIDGAELYLNKNGSLFLVANEPWIEYLHGRSDEMPDEDDLEEISETDFAKIIMNGR